MGEQKLEKGGVGVEEGKDETNSQKNLERTVSELAAVEEFKAKKSEAMIDQRDHWSSFRFCSPLMTCAFANCLAPRTTEGRCCATRAFAAEWRVWLAASGSVSFVGCLPARITD